MRPRSAQTPGRIGSGGHQWVGWRWGVAWRNLRGRRLRNPHPFIEIQVFFGAARTIAFAGIFIAQAGQFVTPVDTVAVASRRCCLDRNQCHARVVLRIRRKILQFSRDLRKEEAAGQTRTAQVARRKCCCAFSRNSSQMDSGRERKTSTTWGSNCVPLQRFTSWRAWLMPRAWR
jgi:hypothetical protein